ncbi:MAG: hypothetical protein U0941_24675 [Planctomycetaceae bacterium]
MTVSNVIHHAGVGEQPYYLEPVRRFDVWGVMRLKELDSMNTTL